MENNAYKEQVIKINGMEIVIPEVLTFAQIISCEMKGLSLSEVDSKPFASSAIIFSVIAKTSLDEAVELLNEGFSNGLNITETLAILMQPFANFFAQNSNKE